jgi:hypothetical protein
LLPATAVAVDGALVTALVDDVLAVASEPDPDVVVVLAALAVEVLAVAVVGVAVLAVAVLAVPVLAVAVLGVVVVVVVVVAVLAAAVSCETPVTSVATRATVPATALEPSTVARRNRRLGEVGAFIPATITPSASGQPHHNIKPVLTSPRCQVRAP